MAGTRPHRSVQQQHQDRAAGPTLQPGPAATGAAAGRHGRSRCSTHPGDPPKDAAVSQSARFTHDLVQALAELEKRAPPSRDALAARALDKLGYDLPVVSLAELDALTTSIRVAASEVKVGASPLPRITPKLLHNATSAVLASLKPGQPLIQQQQGAQGGTQPPLPPEAPTLVAPPPTPAEHAAACQRLCAALLLHLPAALLQGLRGRDVAWAVLGALPSAPDCDTDGSEAGAPAALRSDEDPGLQPRLEAAQDAGTGLSSAYEAVDAAEQDDDSMDYEPMDADQGGVAMGSRPADPGLGSTEFLGQAAAGSADAAAGGWDASLQARLAVLCSERHLSALCVPLRHPCQHAAGLLSDATPGQPLPTNDPGPEDREALLWELPGVQAALLRVIRAVGLHEGSSSSSSSSSSNGSTTSLPAARPEPLLSAFLTVAAEWCEATPWSVEALLPAVWDALGMAGLQSARQRPKRAPVTAVRALQPVLLPEVDAALWLTACVYQKVRAQQAGRAALWRAVHHHMLPVLERGLVDVAAAGAQHPGAPAAAASVCGVVRLYIEERPRGTLAWDTLRSSGVLRALCAAFPSLAAHPDGEALRSALLMTAAGSAAARDWALAVPGVKGAVMGPTFGPGGAQQAHGIVWRLLVGPPGGSSEVAAELAGLLEDVVSRQGSRSDQAKTAHACLQLMLAASRASDSRVEWGPAVQRALAAALAAFKAQAAAARPTPNGGEVRHSLVALAELQTRQWEAECAAALKALVGEGGKGD